MPENQQKSETARREEDILAFWKKHGIFEKSLKKEAPKGEFVFYDGPPFATGLPHYGHILAGTIKDAIPRYRTMRGYHVERKWGWDCHGLPLENQIEEELRIKTKKDIEAMGVGTFNLAARAAVLRYAEDWKRIIPRMGRWVDMERDYRTMDTSYTESVWWAFKRLYDKRLAYEGFKSMHLCPRCGTTLSNFEVSQGYKDITDLSVIVKFELVDEPGTYLLAWTTTPWTLPGNIAVALNEDATYVIVREDGKRYVIAREQLSQLHLGYTIEREIPGAAFIGKKYRPPFSYFEAQYGNDKKAWRVYHAPYVSLKEGTGIVHLAPAFGEEDLALAQSERLPLIHHVGFDGAFTPEVTDFAGMQAKPKEDHQSSDVEIVKNLAERDLLYKKEKLTHSYPHCWRCETPLLNYATSSWFVQVTAIRDRLVAENKKIRWVPKDVRDGRFGKWLEGARDWAISRSRYWGAPLPVWKNKDGKVYIIGSVEEMRRCVKGSGNRYIVMRHGEAESNVGEVVDADPAPANPLTERGRRMVRSSSDMLKKQFGRIDHIIVSPLQRTRDTARIVAAAFGIPESVVAVDDRLREMDPGALNRKSSGEYHSFLEKGDDPNDTAPPDGESGRMVKRRIGAVIYDLEKRYQRKIILIVTHDNPAFWLTSAAWGEKHVESSKRKALPRDSFLPVAGFMEVPFTPLPHNENYGLDLHRPFIDEVQLIGDSGEPLTRIPDVFDCWFESGSMPYGSTHYPFEHRDRFEPLPGFLRKARGYPADFIAESIDQTRGWFYSLLVLGVALFARAPYRNVITNGLVLAEDGRKMSKKLKNYRDPVELVSTYGADAMRYYLLSSPIIRGEDLNFSEKGVDEIHKKLILRLQNVFSFLTLYGAALGPRRTDSPHVLDRWVLARLAELTRETTAGYENYELDRATRPLMDFVEDLSTWYLRRSRVRIKEEGSDREAALATLRHVLFTLAHLMAPALPFFAEYLYRHMREGGEPESVHLSAWPKTAGPDRKILADMKEVRRVVSLGFEERARAQIAVRQPLSRLAIGTSLAPEYLALIKDEVNVKTITVDASLQNAVSLDTALSPELVEEGNVRELVRAIQNARKKAGLTPADRPSLTVSGDGTDFVFAHKDELMKAASLAGIARGEGGEVVELSHFTVRLALLTPPA